MAINARTAKDFASAQASSANRDSHASRDMRNRVSRTPIAVQFLGHRIGSFFSISLASFLHLSHFVSVLFAHFSRIEKVGRCFANSCTFKEYHSYTS